MEQEKKEKRQRKRGDKRSRQKRKTKQSPGENQKGASSLLPKVRVGTHQSSLPPVTVKRVVEPEDTCVLCQKPIDLIASALSCPQGGYAHFDCVLAHLSQERKLGEGQKISYIGRGSFAVVHEEADGSFTFLERIAWENAEAFDAMKKYVEANKS
ncbi:MAG: hypothetical protein QM434_08490 [Spirochaetota bacterium]|jgi:hypothetical protein|nr:hypothetical protein [Spirochaetota bacterium]